MIAALRQYEEQKIRFAHWLHRHKLTHLIPMSPDGLSLAEEIPLPTLLPLCVMENRKDSLSLHSLWFLEKYVKAHPDKLPVAFLFLLDNIQIIRIEGSQRILGNILIHQLKGTRKTAPLDIVQEEVLIEHGFNWLISLETSVAVVANAIEMLYLLSPRHPWITPELIVQIEHLLHQGTTPAIHSRGSRILQKLKK